MILLLLALLACGPRDGDSGSADSSADSAADTNTDTDTASETDTSTDTGADTGSDTGPDTGGDGPLLWNIGGYCTIDACTWYAGSDGRIGSVELYLSETGDTSSPEFWEEVHTAFALAGPSGYGGDEFSIELDLVSDYTEQVDNVSTLFDLNDSRVARQLTVLFILHGADGAYADCATFGHDPSYFESVCTNNWN